MKVTEYLKSVRLRPDRRAIEEEWIARTVIEPEHAWVQADGRIRRWRRIPEADGRWLRVVVLADGETVHNAFFDRSFSR